MKLQLFHLFYALVFILIILGIWSKDIQFLTPGFDTTFVTGFWSLIIPVIVYLIINAMLYHFRSRFAPIKKSVTIVHLILVMFGISTVFLFLAKSPVDSVQNMYYLMPGQNFPWLFVILLVSIALIFSMALALDTVHSFLKGNKKTIG